MPRQIKIGADVSDFKKSLLDLSKSIDQQLGKKGIELFDKDTKEMLLGQAERSTERLGRQIDKLKNISKGYQEQLKTAAKNSKEELDARTKLIRATRRLVDLEKQRNTLTGMRGADAEGLSLRSVSGFGRIGARLPGMRGLIGLRGGLGGGGAAGMAGLAGLGLAAGAGAFGISRLRGGYGGYRTSLEDRMALMGRFGTAGMGGEPTTGRIAGMQNLGFAPAAARRAQIQAMDIFGAQGAGAGAVTGRAGYARARGLDLSQLQGMGAPLRAAMGTAGANREFTKMLAAAEASEIKEALGPWLETASNMLVSIKENGMGLTDTALLALGNLTTKGGFSPERAAKLMTGINQAIIGSTGDVRAAFMMAYAGQGIGARGGIAGVEEAVSTGLFGIDPKTAENRFTPGAFAAYKRLGLIGTPGEAGRRAGAVLGQMSLYTAGIGGDQREIARGLVAKQMFNLQSGAQGQEVIAILEEMKGAKENTKKMAALQEKLENVLKSPQEKAASLMETQLGFTQKTTAAAEAASEELGERIGPAVDHMRQLLISIDKGMSTVAAWFGGRTEEERIAAEKPIGGLTRGDIERYFPTPGDKERLGKETERAIAEERKKLAKVEAVSVTGTTMGLSQAMADVSKQMLDKLTKQLVVNEELLNVQRQAEATGKKTENNTKDKKGVTPSRTEGSAPGPGFLQ